MSKRTQSRVLPIVVLLLVAAASRLLPHPPNFTPLGAMALLGSVTLGSMALAVLLPLLALYISDLVLNNVVYAAYQESFTWGISVSTYLGFLAVVALGWLLLRGRGLKAGRIFGVTLLGSLAFYLITNFFSWWIDPFGMYADGPAGLLASYVAAIPFFFNSLAGDLFFSGLLFTAYGYWQSRQPQLAG